MQNEPRILAVDTSTKMGSVAMLVGEKLLKDVSYSTEQSHAEVLITKVAKIIQEPSALAVAIGPGSFTGLRIGLATVKGLALAKGLPIYGISTLAALQYCAKNSVKGKDGHFIPCLNAYRGEVYSFIDGVMPECSVTPAELVARLKKLSGDIYLIGDGTELCADKRFTIIKKPKFSIAAGVAFLAKELIDAGKSPDDLSNLVPNYIRKSDAEIKASL